MKYIKTNEELFSKPVIPQSFIDDMVKDISTKYKTEVIKGGNLQWKKSSDYKKDLEKVTIRTKTTIGNIDIVLTLYKGQDTMMMDKSFISKIKTSLSTPKIRYEIFYNGRRTGYTHITLKEAEKKDYNMLRTKMASLSSIDRLIDDVNREREERKKEEDFYDRITVDEVKDLIADLSDIIGEYEINKYNDWGKKGFIINFQIKGDYLSSKSKSGILLKPTDEYLEIVKELNSLYKRLLDGYDLKMNFLIQGDYTKTLTIIIKENEASN